jgi:hypothetical protein
MSVCGSIVSGNGSQIKKPETSMNFEELENTWTRQLVVGQPMSAELVRTTLVGEVRRRSRRVRRIIGVAAFVFVTGWTTALITHYTGIKPFTRLNLTYLAAVTCFDFLFFVLAFRSLRRNRREEERMGDSLIDAVRGSLRAVEWQLRDCRLLAYGAAAASLGSVGFVFWKYASGELPVRGLIATVVIDVIFTVAFALTLRRYYERNLKPRREELRQQLRELEN